MCSHTVQVQVQISESPPESPAKFLTPFCCRVSCDMCCSNVPSKQLKWRKAASLSVIIIVTGRVYVLWSLVCRHGSLSEWSFWAAGKLSLDQVCACLGDWRVVRLFVALLPVCGHLLSSKICYQSLQTEAVAQGTLTLWSPSHAFPIICKAHLDIKPL